MRYVPLAFCFVVVHLIGAICAAQATPSYQTTDVTVLTMGDKVAGRIGACMVGHRNKPKVCFGLTKEIDGEPRFTFLVVFRTGDKNCKPTGSESQLNSDGMVTSIKKVYSLGEFDLPLALESKRDPDTGKLIESNVTIGTLKLFGAEPGVVIVDLTGAEPAYKLVKVKLPTCTVRLSDEDHKTWPMSIDDAIAQLKKASDEINTLAD